MTRLFLAGAAALALCACGNPKDNNSEVATSETAAASNTPMPAALTVTSASFEAGGMIPAKYADKGGSHSPALSWSGAPAGTQSFAVICEDPDAPKPTPFVHWVMFDVPAAATGFAEDQIPPDARQGKNGKGQAAWTGPAPPKGPPHHYRFQVFALDQTLGLDAGATRDQLVDAMKGHVLAQGEVIGLFQS